MQRWLEISDSKEDNVCSSYLLSHFNSKHSIFIGFMITWTFFQSLFVLCSSKRDRTVRASHALWDRHGLCKKRPQFSFQSVRCCFLARPEGRLREPCAARQGRPGAEGSEYFCSRGKHAPFLWFGEKQSVYFHNAPDITLWNIQPHSSSVSFDLWFQSDGKNKGLDWTILLT